MAVVDYDSEQERAWREFAIRHSGLQVMDPEFLLAEADATGNPFLFSVCYALINLRNWIKRCDEQLRNLDNRLSTLEKKSER